MRDGVARRVAGYDRPCLRHQGRKYVCQCVCLDVVATPAANATANASATAVITLVANASADYTDKSAVAAPAVDLDGSGFDTEEATPTLPNQTYMAKTFSELQKMIDETSPVAESKAAEVTGMEQGAEKDAAKAELGRVKDTLLQLKTALKFKKDNMPVILMTAAGEPIPRLSDEEEVARVNASSAMCTSLGGHIADIEGSMCCSTGCANCGGGNPEKDECKADVIKATKICAVSSTVPCMIKLLATQESKDNETKWNEEQGISGLKSENKPWWHVW
eukprot:SAG22_NODE_484_length_9912_cov_23.425150_9_plen_277_part_00